MRQKILALALAISCSACVEKPAYSQTATLPAKPDPKWLQCQVHADCVASFGPCGEWLAVNRKSIKQEQEWAIREGRALSCETNRNPEPKTVCRKRICTILP